MFHWYYIKPFQKQNTGTHLELLLLDSNHLHCWIILERLFENTTYGYMIGYWVWNLSVHVHVPSYSTKTSCYLDSGNLEVINIKVRCTVSKQCEQILYSQVGAHYSLDTCMISGWYNERVLVLLCNTWTLKLPIEVVTRFTAEPAIIGSEMHRY